MRSKTIAAIKEELRNKPTIVLAKDAAQGQWYITKKGNMLIRVDSKGPDVCSCTYLSCYGTEERCDVTPDYQMTLDKNKEELLMAKHKKAEARCATLKKEKTTGKTGTTATKEKKTGTRGNKDPRTGYGTETTAHLVGTIMLDTGVANKEACISKIEKAFKKATLYPEKELYWARAWYHNHIAKKPEIYNKG